VALTYTPGAAYGWRARIGVLGPARVYDTHPYEFYLMVPSGVQLVISSWEGPESRDFSGPLFTDLETCVKRVHDRGVDVILQTGIPYLVVPGWGIEDELRKRMAKVTPVPYLTDAAASIAAMKALGVSRIVAIGPGPLMTEQVAERINAYLKHVDIELVHHEVVPSPSPTAFPTPDTVYRTARSAYRRAKRADAIWMPGAPMPSVAVIDAIERDVGASVVTSFQALIWAGLQKAGVRERITGFGRLFDLELPS
jgi:maleate cis-trans isomerase